MSTASLRLRGLAALVVLVLFPFFVLFLAIALVMAGIWVAENVSGNLGGHVALLIVPLMLAVLAAVRDIIKARKPRPVPGDELSREDHPALWSELDALANAMQQPRPDRVVVLPTVNAFVTTAAGHREVMIGYPLLAGFSRAQLRAVLAHEMGHLAHGHTRTGGLAYRASGLLENTLGRLNNGLLHVIVSGYYRFYLLISMSVLRDHERQADDWSARLAGGPESASVFPALARLGAVWTVLCDSYLPLAGQVNARPDLREAIERLSESNQAELDAAVAHQLALSPSRWSTHPADAERMQRLQAAPALSAPKTVAAGAVSTMVDSEAAWHLLGRQQPWVPLEENLAAAALRQIEAGLMSPDAAPASWAQIVQTSQLEDVRNHVGLLLDQFRRQAPGRRADIRELLSALADSGPALLTPMLRGDLPPEHRDRIVQQAVTEAARSAILLTVAEQGRARSVLRWDAPAQWQFLRSNRNAVAWPEELTPAGPLTRAEADRLLDQLTRNGIDVPAPLATDALEAEPTTASSRTLRSVTAGAVVGAMVRPSPPGTTRRTMYDVLVMDDGLLFSRIGRKELGFVTMMKVQAGAGSLGRDGVTRVQKLSHDVDGDPQGWAAVRSNESFWVPFPTIESATLRKPRGGFWPKRITLERAGREPLSIRWTAYTFEVEQVDSVLRAALHGRVR